MAPIVALGLLLAAASRAQEAPPPPVVDVFAPLDAHPALKTLDLTRLRDDPVVLAIQAPRTPVEGHVERVGKLLGDFALALVELLRGDYLTPAGLSPRAGRETLLIVVLRDGKLFAQLRDAAGAPDARDDRAFFDPTLPGVLVLDPGPAEGQPGTLELVRPVCHAAVHALLDASVPPERPLPLWLVEGLAERLSTNNGRLPAKRESLRTFDAESLMLLEAAADDPLLRAASERTLVQLVAVGTRADLVGDAPQTAAATRAALRGLGAGASLFMLWLDEGTLGYLSAEQLQQVWLGRKLARALLAAQPGEDVFTSVLGAGAPATLDESFATWKRDRAAERGSTRARLAAASEVQALAEPALLPPPAPTGAARLAVPAGDARLDRARALQRAADGDFAGGAAALDALLARPDLPAELAGPARVERGALAQLADLRRRWVAEHAGKAVDLRDGDATLRATLTGLTGDKLQVKDGPRARELPLDALQPGTLAGLLLAPDTQLSPSDDEARALAWLLSPDAAWKDRTQARVRKESGADVQALLERRAEIETELRLGRTLAALAALADAPVPDATSTPAARDAWIARASAALAARDLPVVAERLPALRTLLHDVLAGAFDAAPLDHVALHGKVERLDGGRVRVRWDFSDAEQLLDFTSLTLRESDLGLMRPIKNPPQGPPGLSVEAKQLVLRGRGHWRCVLPLAAPMSLTCELQGRHTPAEADGSPVGDTQAMWLLRLCADTFGSYLQDEWLGRLKLHDKLAGASELAEPTVAGWLLDKWYQVRLEHDGTKLRALVDGVQVSACSVARRTHGFVELLCNTERLLCVRLLVVEGTPDLEALATVRDAWVGERMAALGAGP